MRPFWQDLVLQLTGPIFVTIIGTTVIGFVAQRLARRNQDKREAHRLRDGLISEATEAAVGLYAAIQRYRRSVRMGLSGAALGEERSRLDQRYASSRVAGEVLEARLFAYYAAPAPRQRMHQVMDLLTVRYFQLLNLDSDELRNANAGDDHTGLSASELRDPKVVVQTYKVALLQFFEALVEFPLQVDGVRRAARG